MRYSFYFIAFTGYRNQVEHKSDSNPSVENTGRQDGQLNKDIGLIIIGVVSINHML